MVTADDDAKAAFHETGSLTLIRAIMIGIMRGDLARFGPGIRLDMGRRIGDMRGSRPSRLRPAA